MPRNAKELPPVLRKFADGYNVPTPDSAMRVACRKLLENCNIQSAPVPLKQICRQLNIKTVKKTTPGSATLRFSKSGVEIWIDPDKEKWRRERFTIAHEIAHIVLINALKEPKLISALSENSDVHNEVERLCNIGASELLMPNQLVVDALETYGLTTTGLQFLYDNFLVSFRTLLFRIAQVTPSSAIILWKRYSRERQEPVAMRVLTCYQEYKSNSYAPWLPKGSTTKHLFPDIVTVANEKRQTIYAEEINLELNNKLQSCVGVGSVLPMPRAQSGQLPLFEGNSVFDEERVGIDAILLVGHKGMSQNSRLWSKLKEHSTQ